MAQFTKKELAIKSDRNIEQRNYMKILKFYADWCMPCRVMSMAIETIKDEIPFEIEKIDGDKNPDMIDKYNIRGYPTIVIVDGETEVKRHTGTMSPKQLKEFVKVS